MRLLFSIQQLLEKQLLRLFDQDLQQCPSLLGAIKIEHSICQDASKVGHIHEILERLPRSIKAYVHRRDLKVVFTESAPWCLRTTNVIFTGRGIFKLDTPEAAFLMTRAVLLLRYRAGRPFALRKTLRSHGPSIDRTTAKLLGLEIG